jgi:hypothetical protein
MTEQFDGGLTVLRVVIVGFSGTTTSAEAGAQSRQRGSSRAARGGSWTTSCPLEAS